MNMELNTLPWIEKYRPVLFDQVVSHDDIKRTLKLFIKDQSLPHTLFYGPPGTGKTTMINICARELYGPYHQCMVMELNASDDRGIEIVRNKIKQFVTSKNIFFDTPNNSNNSTNSTNSTVLKPLLKLVILDEVDAMTSDAQSILRKIIETYTHTTRFCLICNYIQNINEALQSRCFKFRFCPITDVSSRMKINEIAQRENIKITPQAINNIIKKSNGDMRNVLNIFQSVSTTYNKIDEAEVNQCIGYPTDNEIVEIINYLFTKPYAEAYEKIKEIKNRDDIALDDVIKEIHDILFDYVIGINHQALTLCFSKDHKIKLEIKRILHILDKLRTIEYNNTVNLNDNIQLSAIVGLFQFTFNEYN